MSGERPGKRGWYLTVLQVRFEERVVVADPETAERASDPKVGEQLGRVTLHATCDEQGVETDLWESD